ncbi:hypothetical protein DL240_04835 [Lujinxingia litoralis]|uniref:TonB C-terminal domain-containing protein n=2 Tax=Lujinxingia litoralis TaxID=2211119 RepID=A0A328C7F8_9DELT|nr:hypothetical protein DL240_04835 [Lujinxingia litoralis]
MLIGVGASVAVNLLAAGALAFVIAGPTPDPEDELMEVVLEPWEPEFDPERPAPELSENRPEEQAREREAEHEQREAPEEPAPPDPLPSEEALAEESAAQEEPPVEPAPAAIAVELQVTRESEEPEDADFIAEVAMRVDQEMVAAETTLENTEPPEPEDSAEAPESEPVPEAPEMLSSASDWTEDDLVGAREDEGTQDQVAASAHEAPAPDQLSQSSQAAPQSEQPAPEPTRPPPAAEMAMALPTEHLEEAPLVPERLEQPVELEGRDPSPAESQAPVDSPDPSTGQTEESLGPAQLFGRSMQSYQEVFEQRDAERADEIAEGRSAQRRRLLANWRGDSERLRATLENYIPHVQVGNHTQVNAASAAHATMIARMHRRYIHPQWALSFVQRIETTLPGRHPLNDLSLYTQLEIVIDGESGAVVDVIRLRPSGNEVYDGQAIMIAWSIGSLAPVPDEVISPDGRVYIHWDFYRNQRLCGTFGAKIFRLAERDP